MNQWNSQNRIGVEDYITKEELDAAIASVDACKPLTEEEMDSLFPMDDSLN